MVPTEFPQSSSPLVVAHRGASAELPENTLPAFEGALAAGADVIETDVRLTSDGVPIVLHDAYVDRVTDGVGLASQLSLSQIKRLDASGGRGARTEIPTLAEVLELMNGRAGINLEIKNIPGEPGFDSPHEATVEAALADLERAGFSGSVLVSSFNWITIERSKELAPEVPTGFLTIVGIAPEASLTYVRQAGHRYVLPHVSEVLAAGQAFVASAHGDGVRVGTWTVDDPDVARTLFSWGVDAVATNDPETMVRLRDEVTQGVQGGSSPA